MHAYYSVAYSGSLSEDHRRAKYSKWNHASHCQLLSSHERHTCRTCWWMFDRPTYHRWPWHFVFQGRRHWLIDSDYAPLHLGHVASSEGKEKVIGGPASADDERGERWSIKRKWLRSEGLPKSLRYFLQYIITDNCPLPGGGWRHRCFPVYIVI